MVTNVSRKCFMASLYGSFVFHHCFVGLSHAFMSVVKAYGTENYTGY